MKGSRPKDRSSFSRLMERGLDFIMKSTHQLVVLLILLFLSIFHHYMTPDSKHDLPKVGDVSNREIIADFSFPVLKHPDSLAREHEEVLKNVPILLEYNKDVGKAQIARFDSVFERTMSIMENKRLPAENRSDSLSLFFNIKISESDVDFLDYLRKPGELKGAVESELDHIYDEGFYSTEDFGEKQVSYYFSIKKSGKETPYTKELVLTREDALERFRIDLLNRFQSLPEKGEFAIKLGQGFLEPNLVPNWDSTEVRRKRQLSTVKSEKDRVVKNERIIGLHEKVTEETLLKLISMYKALDQGKISDRDNAFLNFASRIGIHLMLLVLLSMFLIKFHPEIWNNRRYFDFFSGLMIFIYISAYLIRFFMVSFLLLPIAFLAVAFALFLNLNVSLVGIFFIVASISIGFKQDLSTFLTLLMPGITILLSFRDLTHRTQIYKPILYAIVLTSLFTLSTDYIQDVFILPSLQRMGIHAVGILLSAVIGIFLITPFEYFLKSTTHFTLNDYATTNHQLLKQLSVEGPGTYHHSMNVANLAENAAEVIGADLMLCRAGGYFHDIGKLSRPEYFNENNPPESMHKHLSPMESASILVSHVKEGVDIARSNHLPEPVVDIIKQHHGTTVMRFFYEKALEIDSSYTEDNFKYPGPKPASREAAIIMMSDICEAGTRSIYDKNPESISELVETLVAERLLDGQFDESGITIKEISEVKQSLIKGLLGIHHKRVMEDTTQMEKF